MSKRVLPFRVKALSPDVADSAEPPRPVISRPGDRFVQVDVVDDLYAHVGFFPGALFIAQANRILDGNLHYVEWNGYSLLARLSQDPDGMIDLSPLDRVTPDGTVTRDALGFVGAIVEMYPLGLYGSRWALVPRGDACAERSFIEAVAT